MDLFKSSLLPYVGFAYQSPRIISFNFSPYSTSSLSHSLFYSSAPFPSTVLHVSFNYSSPTIISSKCSPYAPSFLSHCFTQVSLPDDRPTTILPSKSSLHCSSSLSHCFIQVPPPTHLPFSTSVRTPSSVLNSPEPEPPL